MIAPSYGGGNLIASHTTESTASNGFFGCGCIGGISSKSGISSKNWRYYRVGINGVDE
jgi:hypothetical protein